MNIIVAYDFATRGIGLNGNLPWRIPEDLKHFAETTRRKTVIMGRKTWDSLPNSAKPLPWRKNIVLSRDITFKIKHNDVVVMDTLPYIEGAYIIGGEEIYRAYLETRFCWIDTIYATLVFGVAKEIKFDSFFPSEYSHLFEVVREESTRVSSVRPYSYKYVRYVKNRAPTDDIAEECHALDTLERLTRCPKRENRTGIPTFGMFGKTFNYTIRRNDDGSYSIPMMTTKRMFLRGIFEELMWFLRGETDSKILEEKGVNAWKGNSSRHALDNLGLDYPEGENGPIYGKQWRRWETTDGKTIDQLERLLTGLVKNPYSRRHILSAWNVGDLDKMSLSPCHMMYQFYVKDKKLSMLVMQRSGDAFLAALSWNVTSFALMLIYIARHCGYEPHRIVHTIGDLHVYETHLDQISKQCLRVPFEKPRIKINNVAKKITDNKWSDINVEQYSHYGAISAPMAV